jgi:hypothetical protein
MSLLRPCPSTSSGHRSSSGRKDLCPIDSFEFRSLPPTSLRPENDVHKFLTMAAVGCVQLVSVRGAYSRLRS